MCRFATLFRITTGESWNGLLEDLSRGLCLDDSPDYNHACGGRTSAYLFMYSFYLLGCLIMFNLFVAVILDNMATEEVVHEHPLGPKQFWLTWKVSM